jgi:hypothetical protein
MDDLLRRLLAESRRLSELGKEAGYEAFIELVDLREQVIRAMDGRKLTAEQQQLLRELKTHESVLLGHMQELLRDAEAGLCSFRNSRIQQRAYQAYAPSESMLLDKKQ